MAEQAAKAAALEAATAALAKREAAMAHLEAKAAAARAEGCQSALTQATYFLSFPFRTIRPAQPTNLSAHPHIDLSIELSRHSLRHWCSPALARSAIWTTTCDACRARMALMGSSCCASST